MKKICFILLSCAIATCTFGQGLMKPDLRKLNQEEQLEVVNRSLSFIPGDGLIIHLDEKDNAGFIWLKNYVFENGTIEFDAKGKDVVQKSFVGIAFHGVNNEIYDAIYFRPFNFRADNALSRSHAVQYISPPEYDWDVLREKFPNKYEQPIAPAPDPNQWFHVKITVKGQYFAVYVNNSPLATLYVQQLKPLAGKKIGLWVGNGSGGDWKNLMITPAR